MYLQVQFLNVYFVLFGISTKVVNPSEFVMIFCKTNNILAEV